MEVIENIIIKVCNKPKILKVDSCIIFHPMPPSIVRISK